MISFSLTNWRLWCLIGIFVFHVSWVVFHNTLAYHGQVNQWKGGGYGMYTGPSPRPYYYVYVEDGHQPLSPADHDNLRHRGFHFVNRDFTYYCRSIGVREINVLLADNLILVGRDLRFTFYRDEMLLHPIRREAVAFAQLTIEWVDDERYRFVHEYCDDRVMSGDGFFDQKQ